MEIWDHRWRDGTREPLAADLSSPASRQRSAAVAGRCGRADRADHRTVGIPPQSGRAQLRRAGRGHAADTWASRWASPGGSRCSAASRWSGSGPKCHYALEPTPGADAGLNPGHRLAGHASSSSSTRRSPALGARIAGGDFDGEPRAQGPAQSTLAAGDRAPRRPVRAPVRSRSPPRPSSPPPPARRAWPIDSRVTDLQTTLANDFGVSGFSDHADACPTRSRPPSEFVAALSDPSGPLAPAAGRQQAHLPRRRRGGSGAHAGGSLGPRARIAAGSAPRSRDWCASRPAALAQPDRRARAWAPATARPTSRLRITTDLGAGRWGLRAEGMYNRQLAADYILRVAPPTQPLAGLDRLSAVRRDPGDIVSLAVRPFFRLAPTFALQGTRDLLVAGRGRGHLPHRGRRDPGRGRVGARAGQQGQRDHARIRGHLQQPGTLPAGGTVACRWMRAGATSGWCGALGGIVPDRHAMRARFRFYFGLF